MSDPTLIEGVPIPDDLGTQPTLTEPAPAPAPKARTKAAAPAPAPEPEQFGPPLPPAPEPEIDPDTPHDPTVEERVAIMLEENDDIPPPGLYVGLNGYGYLIKPGVEVMVPLGVVSILDNATMMAPTVDPQTRRVVGWRQKQRYPYRRV